MDITRKDFDKLTKDAQDALVANGCTIIEEKVLSEAEVKAIADSVVEPLRAEVKAAKVAAEPKRKTTFVELVGKTLKDKTNVKATLASAFNSQESSADGADVLAEEVAAEVLQPVFTGNIIGKTYQIPVAGDALRMLSLPITTTTVARLAAQGTKKGEAKLAYAKSSIVVHTIAGTINVSNELLSDYAQFASQARNVLASDIAMQLEDELFNGTGTEELLGITVSDAIVDVARGTAADIKEADVYNMWSKFCKIGVDLSNSAWIYSPAATAKLMALRDRDKGIERGLINTMLGVPMIESVFVPGQTLGDDYDLILCDFSKYGLGIKGGLDPVIGVNPYLYWLYNVTNIRGEIRCAGAPRMNDTVTINGVEQGYFVGLTGAAT